METLPLEIQVKTMNRRKLKVYEAPTGTSKRIPYIRLQGKWLLEFGFNTGDNIVVKEEEGKLIIEHEKVAEND